MKRINKTRKIENKIWTLLVSQQNWMIFTMWIFII